MGWVIFVVQDIKYCDQRTVVEMIAIIYIVLNDCDESIRDENKCNTNSAV